MTEVTGMDDGMLYFLIQKIEFTVYMNNSHTF